MENRPKIFKYICIPLLLVLCLVSLVGYMAWKEYKTKSDLINLALQGNQQAIGILKKYEAPWRLNEKLLYQALDGNEYAIEVLQIGKD